MLLLLPRHLRGPSRSLLPNHHNHNGMNQPHNIDQCRSMALQAFGKAVEVMDTYEVGQAFIHREYGYRGIVFDSWVAHVHYAPVTDRSLLEANYQEEHHYKVLRDIRDDSKEMKNMRVPSYVSHGSMLPFTPIQPLTNGVIDYFFRSDGLRYKPNENYERQYKLDHPPLTRAHIYRQTSNGITVQVIPIFDAKTSGEAAVWRYHVRIANHSNQTVQLKKREWEIAASEGNSQIVYGDGVVGKFPVIPPGDRFEYESWTPRLQTSAWMKGQYILQNRETGTTFPVTIPKFWLLNDTPKEAV